MSIGTSSGEGNSPEKPNYITVKSILLMSALRQRNVTLIGRMPGDVRHFRALFGVQTSPRNTPPRQGSDLRMRKRLRSGIVEHFRLAHKLTAEVQKLDQSSANNRFFRLRVQRRAQTTTRLKEIPLEITQNPTRALSDMH